MTDHFYILLVLLFSTFPAMAVDNTYGIDVDIPKVRVAAPGFTLTKENTSISLSQYAGNLVILNFWSLDCKPCRDEMNSLDVLSKIYHDRGLTVLAISISDDSARINQFSRNKNYSITLLVDEDRELREKYKINAVPITYIVGRDGKFIARLVGARNWSSSDMKRFIESNL